MARVKYSKQQREKILQYVREYDKQHGGRGGLANATKKFKITFPTMKSWLADDKGNKPAQKPAVQKPVAQKPSAKEAQSKPKKAAVKPAAKKTAPAPVKSSAKGRDEILARLDAIAGLERQVEELRNKIEKEKTAIRGLI